MPGWDSIRESVKWLDVTWTSDERIRHCAQNDFEAELASYPMGTGGFILEVNRPSLKYTKNNHAGECQQ
jgi:hypothetical protein